MSYVIAIPSYRRANSQKTIAYLQKTDVDLTNVYVFLSDKDELTDYRAKLPHEVNIVIGRPKLSGNRHAITDYFDEGQYIMQMDDDVEGLYEAKGKKKELVYDLDEVIRRGFAACSITECYIWAFNPVLNPFFMKGSLKVGNLFCIGSCFGLINLKDEKLLSDVEEKEDYDRTARHIRRFGKTARLNNYAVKTSYYKGEGGLNVERTVQRENETAKKLLSRYPDLLIVNHLRKSPYMEIKFRTNAFSRAK